MSAFNGAVAACAVLPRTTWVLGLILVFVIILVMLGFSPVLTISVVIAAAAVAEGKAPAALPGNAG